MFFLFGFVSLPVRLVVVRKKFGATETSPLIQNGGIVRTPKWKVAILIGNPAKSELNQH